MQTRTKSAFLLLVVLLLGVAVGMLVSGALHNRRMERIAGLRTAPGIAQLVERLVEPESEEQRAQIRQVMDGAAPRFAEVFRRTHDEMEALSDSVMSELEAILTPLQMEQLRARMDMRRGMPGREEWRGRERPGRRAPRTDGPPPAGGRPNDERPPPGMPPPE
jgi:hypothetical protein